MPWRVCNRAPTYDACARPWHCSDMYAVHGASRCAADATDAIIVTPGNSNFYIGGVTFLDTDGNEVSSVFSDGNSNSSIQLNVPAGFEVTIIGKDSTNYHIFGNVTSTTAPAFADQ